MQTVFRSVLLLVASLFTFGCAQNFYNVPRDVYEKQVRTLGVAPIFVDGGSDIQHPEKDAVVNLLRENNRKNEKELVAQLRETGTYFAVRLLEDDADQLFSTLLSRRERRDDAGVKYNKYFFKPEELKNLIAKNGVDALMLVTINGLTRPEKIYSSNLLSYLDSDYNYLAVSAQIMDADGNTLWEYPNFRQRSLTYPMLFSLQYPDFDEAAANESDRVEVRFKTIAGIARAFAKMESASKGKGQVSILYNNIFGDMVSLQEPERNFFGGRKSDDKVQKAAEQK
ncbi:lipoprotein, putative [Geotalea daltonii FRC-32]|uniref:Lipoprotein, putative n=1 Tax=Geotalea daltonii (strain DSM 22248 / JCM 15807 / FRC-32) TaxID=316067 RepID=B9M2L1_GEODF|nr:hypothetical protein [Geotalea daltonii]ACM19390.1 lipoprotein, putative [Geotalea daltonii FRC-32]